MIIQHKKGFCGRTEKDREGGRGESVKKGSVGGAVASHAPHGVVTLINEPGGKPERAYSTVILPYIFSLWIKQR
jgi:hypothetical protein